jgi:hypothetical protein
MADRPSDPISPPCPRCRSPRTIQTFEHFGEHVFFCADCEHTWEVRPGIPVPQKTPRIETAPFSSPSTVDLRGCFALGLRAKSARFMADEIRARIQARIDARERRQWLPLVGYRWHRVVH